MRLIKPSYEIWEQESGLEGVYKMIEKVGRVCYKSEDKIAEGTAKSFVDRLMKSGHGAMLEHGTIYLMIPNDHQAYNFFGDNWVRDTYGASPYSSVVWDSDKIYITTNLRVLVENGWLDDLKYLCEPTEYHVKRVTVHFVCDRGVSHEFVRHRVFSFAQESTRYCNYSKDKFGNEVTFIEPCWYNTSKSNDLADEYFINSLKDAERLYFNLLDNGWKPQEARAVLPNALKTELVMTGFVDESGWINFFNLRALGTTGAPHPQAKELAEPLFEEFKAKGLIK
jgi:thymidylate synthase (FAD)